MKQAASGGARIIHFPEGAISGCTKAQIKGWDQLEWGALADALQQVANLARELELWTVLGSSHRLTPSNRRHNSLYVLSARGEVVTRYDKRFRSHTEITGWYTPGGDGCVFELKGWRFGCALCIEIHFLELFPEYADREVDCVLFSAYADEPMFGIQAQGNAASHSDWVGVSVSTQMSHGLYSRLIAPTGEIQAEARPSTSEVVVDLLDEQSPRREIALHRARPWRVRAREGSSDRGRHVQDPRGDVKTGF